MSINDYSFINLLKNKVIVPWLSSKPISLLWSFSHTESSLFKIPIYECEMRVDNLKAKGYGTSLSPKFAALLSWAEAWERLIVLLLKDNLKCCKDEGIFELFNNNIFLLKSSVGFAAGSTCSHSRVMARQELLERAYLLSAVENNCFINKSPHLSCGNRVLKKIIEMKTGDVSLCSIVHKSVEKCYVAWVSDEPSRCDSVFVSSSPQKDMRKLLFSIAAGNVSPNRKEGVFKKTPFRVDNNMHFKTLYNGPNMPAVSCAYFSDKLLMNKLKVGSQVECIVKLSKKYHLSL